jgi:hypothetical protein
MASRAFVATRFHELATHIGEGDLRPPQYFDGYRGRSIKPQLFCGPVLYLPHGIRVPRNLAGHSILLKDSMEADIRREKTRQKGGLFH